MTTFVEIAVNVPQVTGVFHYHLPPELEGRLAVGHLVEAPFGRQRVQGVVLRFVDEPVVPETRPIASLIDPHPVVTPAQIALAQHLSESMLAPLSACMALMLPSGIGQQVDTLFELTDEGRKTMPLGTTDDESLRPSSFVPRQSELQVRLLKLLAERGPLRGRQIDALMPKVDWRAAARPLARRKLLAARPVLPPPAVQPKVVRTVTLACAPEKALASLDGLGKAGSEALVRRQAMLRYLLREPGPVDVAWVYAESGGSLADLRRLAELSLVTLGEGEALRDPLAGLDFQPTQPPALTGDQAAAWAEIQQGIQEAACGQPPPPYLLHGVTGSGKTEIYLHAVAEVLRHGMQAIVLVPEIALTPQTVRRFISRFPGQVGLAHSGLSAGERYDTWRRARSGSLAVVVGPRSALFTPFPRLGLIVLDECHDPSYYQDDPPFYDARQAAAAYARLAGAVCLLGSATPDIPAAYRAAQGEWRYVRLPARILAHREAVRAQLERVQIERPAGALSEPERSVFRPLEAQAETADLPPVQIIDMRQELKAGNRTIFSRVLRESLERILVRGEQAILFLNRRGTATYVFCRDCGYVVRCPRCELPLTQHITPSKSSQRTFPGLQGETVRQVELVCHYCGYERGLPKTCPDCGSLHIRQYGMGTERLEAEVQGLFPQARTLRWDHETTRYKGAHEIILSHFAAHRADVLVGTQMLAKGLDLPLVTLVGVVLADVGLNLPDAFAAERAFQILTQVAGRAGRSPLGGQVILQTFEPDNYVIQAAAGHNYRAFYQRELEYRRKLAYPPYTRLVRLEYRHGDAAQAEAAARSLAVQVKAWLAAEDRRATEIIGPAPCFFARIAGLYRWQIVLRGPDPASLLRNKPLGEWRVEVDPVSLL
jgi:primosomal protein N' (replication factor Y)